jgi:hypothetical protein
VGPGNCGLQWPSQDWHALLTLPSRHDRKTTRLALTGNDFPFIIRRCPAPTCSVAESEAKCPPPCRFRPGLRTRTGCGSSHPLHSAQRPLRARPARQPYGRDPRVASTGRPRSRSGRGSTVPSICVIFGTPLSGPGCRLVRPRVDIWVANPGRKCLPHWASDRPPVATAITAVPASWRQFGFCQVLLRPDATRNSLGWRALATAKTPKKGLTLARSIGIRCLQQVWRNSGRIWSDVS